MGMKWWIREIRNKISKRKNLPIPYGEQHQPITKTKNIIEKKRENNCTRNKRDHNY